MSDSGKGYVKVENGRKMDFVLPSSSGNDFVSNENLPLVVYFYPKDNTPGCTIESIDFNNNLDEFKKLGYTVVGISKDSVKSHQNFCTKKGFEFELLSDVDGKVCESFGVLKLKKLFGKEYKGIVRSTFILDENGHIVYEWPEVKVAGHVAEILGVLKNQ